MQPKARVAKNLNHESMRLQKAESTPFSANAKDEWQQC
jgi:hypothetical protein